MRSGTTAGIQAFLISGRTGDSFPPVRGRGQILRFFSDLTTESMGKRRLEDGGRKTEKRAHLRERQNGCSDKAGVPLRAEDRPGPGALPDGATL